MAIVDELQIQLDVETKDAIKSIKALKNALSYLRNETNQGKGLGLDKVAQEVNSFSKAIEGSIGNVERLANSLAYLKNVNIAQAMSDATAQVSSALQSARPANSRTRTGSEEGLVNSASIKSAKESAQVFMNNYSAVEEKLADYIATQKELARGLKVVTQNASKTNAIKNYSEALGYLGITTKKTTLYISQFTKQIGRIVLYRIVRSIMSGIAKSFQEGAQNASLWSKQMQGVANAQRLTTNGAIHFNAVMSELSTTSLYIKNSLGALAVTVLNLLLPAFNAIADVLVNVANALNQLFSALGGATSYTKAIKNNVDYAKSLGKINKELSLLSFDELNQLKSDDKQGGLADYKNMFSSIETPINEGLLKHLELIKSLVAGIGIALLSWLVLGKFITDMAMLTGIVMAIAGGFILAYNAMDAWANGINNDNLLGMLIGVSLVVGGLAIAFGTLGAIVGAVFGGLVLFITGLHEFIATGELTDGAFNAMAIGLGIIAIALAGVTGGISVVVGAIAILALAIYKNFDKVKDWANELKMFCKAFANALLLIFRGLLLGDFKLVGEQFKQMVRQLGNVLSVLIEGIINGIISAFNWFLSGVNAVVNKIGELVGNGWNIDLSIKSVSLPRYATGGVVEDGLFMANHGELVGGFGNGRTAVANNNQIIEGIRAGVIDAMMTVYASTNGQSSEPVIENVFKVDSETLFRMTQKGQQKYNSRYHVVTEF